MNNQNHRCWKVLCWNVRGINSAEKWNPIKDTLTEASCDIFCFQETKRQICDTQFLRKFSPPGFASFEILPSIGASGGLITGWKSSVFSGQLVFQNSFAITIKFIAKHNSDY
jgi:exonuclease III